MSEFIDPLGALPAFLLALLMFGFAPGFVLRLLVLLYPKGDPRRQELVAELYAMRRIERPMWVAEQFETAIFEGPRTRHHLRATRMLCRKRRGLLTPCRIHRIPPSRMVLRASIVVASAISADVLVAAIVVRFVHSPEISNLILLGFIAVVALAMPGTIAGWAWQHEIHSARGSGGPSNRR